MNKNIFVISDIELGQGDIFDDFKDETMLIDFINKISQEPGKNILILNGDTFDFLKMPYKDVFTHHITEDISLWKMQRIIDTYPNIFKALRYFISKRSNRIQFNVGNHDFDIMWPSVQNLIKKTLKENTKIVFAQEFNNQEIHIEHGHQVDYFHKMDMKKPFIKYKGKKLLNLPIGSVSIIKYFIELKKEFPYEESIYPRHQAFESFPTFKKRKQKIARNFILKGLLLNFIIGIGDPISNVPYINFIKHVFSHGLETLDGSKFMRKRFKNIIKLHPNKKVYIMGHMHITHHDIHPTQDHIQIVTDTWRHEFRIQKHDTISKLKNYAKIVYDNNKLISVDLLTFVP